MALLTCREFAALARNYGTGRIGMSCARVHRLIATGQIEVAQSLNGGRMFLIEYGELARWNRRKRRAGRPSNERERDGRRGA